MQRFPLNDKKAPAVEKGTDWRDYKGDVSTSMYGLPVPPGVFVIDLDLYKGVTTADVEELFGCEFEWDEAHIQTTLKGGHHYAFAVSEDIDLVNGTDVLKLKGFDTRSAGKGYIASGEGYTQHLDIEECFEDPEIMLPGLPSEVFDALQAQVKTETDALEVVVANEDRCDITIEQMAEYLECLEDSAADIHWLEIGMGIFHETQGSDEGYELFDQFSQRCSEKYDEENNRKRWNSWANNTSANPKTFRSVIKLAGGKRATEALVIERMKGRIEQAVDRHSLDGILKEVALLDCSKIDEAILTDLLRNSYKVNGVNLTKGDMTKALVQCRSEVRKSKREEEGQEGCFVDDYWFATSQNMYVQKSNLMPMNRQAFNVKHTRETPLDTEGGVQYAANYADYLVEVVHDGMYLPWAATRFEHNGIEYYNMYQETTHEYVKPGTTDICQRVIDHAKWQIEDEKDREIVLSFIAHQVQNPGVRLNWALVVQGVQGNGKTLWAEMMQHFLGGRNVGTVTPSQFGSRFNSWAGNRALITIEELKVDSSMSQYDVLNLVKPLITNETITVEGKGTNSKEVANCANYFATTNFRDAVPIDKHDRRWCVVFSKALDVGAFVNDNPRYFPDLYTDMRDNIDELFTFFAEYEIPAWFKMASRAPETRGRSEMIECSKSVGERSLEDALEEFYEQGVIDEDTIDVTYLQARVDIELAEGDHRWNDFPKTFALKKILLSRGFVADEKRKKVKGKLHRVYSKLY